MFFHDVISTMSSSDYNWTSKGVYGNFKYITIVKNQNGDYHSYFSYEDGTIINPTHHFVNELGIKHDHCKPYNAALNNILKSALVFNDHKDNKKHEQDTCQEKLKIQEKECKNNIEQLQQKNEGQEKECKSTIEQLEKQNKAEKTKCNSDVDELENQNEQLKEMNSQQKKDCKNTVEQLKQKNEEEKTKCDNDIHELENQNDQLKELNSKQEKDCKNNIEQLKQQNEDQKNECKSTVEELEKQIAQQNTEQENKYKATIDELREKNTQLAAKVQKLQTTLETLAEMAKDKSYYHVPEQQDFEYTDNGVGTVLSQDLHYY